MISISQETFKGVGEMNNWLLDRPDIVVISIETLRQESGCYYRLWYRND